MQIIRSDEGMRDLRIERTAHGDAAAVLGELVIVRCASPVPDAVGDLILEVVGRELARGPRYLLVVIHPGMPAPTRRLRDAYADLIGRNEANLRGVAIVLAGVSGFRAAALRSIATAIRYLTKSTHPERFFAHPGSAATWLAEVEPSFAEGEILAALGELDASAS